MSCSNIFAYVEEKRPLVLIREQTAVSSKALIGLLQLGQDGTSLPPSPFQQSSLVDNVHLLQDFSPETFV